MEHEDFYFGNIYTRENSKEKSIRLFELIRNARLSGQAHFTQQLRRLLGEHKSLIASDGTSAPPFPELLDGVDVNQIGLVRIGGRTDINQSTPTLDCTLIFVEGPLHVRPHWTAYKELRSWEIIRTLLIPLRNTGLVSRTVVKIDGNEQRFPLDPERQVRLLFQVAGHPFDPITHGEMATYIAHIEKEDCI
ncbi:hypothetical protein [Pseudomonas brenneri]|uniref:hypothetical protein n=1 Tax=Pseudomonas brenneri TaxID=129817 RepID=UPI003BA1CDA1